MVNIKAVAILIVAVLIGSAAGYAMLSNGEDNGIPGGKDNDLPNGEGDKDGYPSSVTITQNDGKKVEVPTPVERICLVNGNAAEFMQVLGVTDRVVGVSDSIKGNPEYGYIYKDVETIGKFSAPSGEKILELDSTVVIGQCTSMPIKDPAALEALGITVILLDCYGINQQSDDLKQLASLFGTEAIDRAEKYIEIYDRTIGSVTDAAFAEDITCYMELSNGKAYTSKAEMNDLIELAGGYNIVTELLQNPTSSTQLLSNEALITYDDGKGPNFIFIRDKNIKDETSAEELYQTLMCRDGWSELEATKNDNIYIVTQSGILSGPRIYIGLVYLAELFHPGELNMSAADLLKEYNETFGFEISSTMGYHHVSS